MKETSNARSRIHEDEVVFLRSIRLWWCPHSSTLQDLASNRRWCCHSRVLLRAWIEVDCATSVVGGIRRVIERKPAVLKELVTAERDCHCGDEGRGQAYVSRRIALLATVARQNVRAYQRRGDQTRRALNFAAARPAVVRHTASLTLNFPTRVACLPSRTQRRGGHVRRQKEGQENVIAGSLCWPTGICQTPNPTKDGGDRVDPTNRL